MIDISQGLYRAVLAITATANRVLTFPDASGTVLLSTTVVPAARVRNSADQSINTATLTALTFDTEDYDTDTMHSTSSNTSRLTATAAGKYHVSGNMIFAANATGQRQLRFLKNGTTYIAIANMTDVAALAADLHLSTDISLAATDYVEMVVFQTSGGALNSSFFADLSPVFSMHRIGP